jgi:hypothetical protein
LQVAAARANAAQRVEQRIGIDEPAVTRCSRALAAASGSSHNEVNRLRSPVTIWHAIAEDLREMFTHLRAMPLNSASKSCSAA